MIILESSCWAFRKKYADKPAITWYTRRGEEQTRSYAQLGQDALCFGEALCVAGLQGEHIAIASENSYEWIYAFLGITASGSVAVCVDVEQSEQAILDMILRANVKCWWLRRRWRLCYPQRF